MKIEVSEYMLIGSGRERRGALLRVSWDDGSLGYADLHTWPELGQPLFEEILRTQSGEIWERALEASRGDALARARGVALPRAVRQHRLWMSTWDLSVGRVLQTRREGFGAVKVKLNAADLEGEARRLIQLVGWWGDDLRLRFDLNSRGEPESFARFLASLPYRLRELIDYVEDPFVFDERSWRDFARREGLQLAWDQPSLARDSAPMPSQDVRRALEHAARELGCARIWKPLWERQPTEKWARVVVTSSLGHPLGSLWAAAEATRVAPDEIHGCASHLVYAPLPGFPTKMRGDRMAEVVRGENGLGFDTSLARLSWRELELA